MDVDGADPEAMPSSLDDCRAKLEQVVAETEAITRRVAEEKVARERAKLDSARRKHNYFPFVMEFLKILADKGDLVPLMERAKGRR